MDIKPDRKLVILAHELAHLRHFEHGKAHTKLWHQIIRMWDRAWKKGTGLR